MSNARSPTEYARQKLPTLLQRWRGQPGDLVRWYGPTQWRGVPTPALMALTASSMGPSEVVGRLTSDASAVGLYGVEGPQVEAYARNATVRDLLGHASAAMPEYLDALDDQVVTGLANYRRHLAELTAALPSSLRPSSVSTLYAYRLACASYSFGAGFAAHVLGAYETQLSAVPEAERWQRLRELLTRDAARRATIGGMRARGEWGAAHLAVRVDQRVECGRLLAATVGTATGWWGSAETSSDALVALAYAQGAPASQGNGWASMLTVGALAWLVMRPRR